MADNNNKDFVLSVRVDENLMKDLHFYCNINARALDLQDPSAANIVRSALNYYLERQKKLAEVNCNVSL